MNDAGTSALEDIELKEAQTEVRDGAPKSPQDRNDPGPAIVDGSGNHGRSRDSSLIDLDETDTKKSRDQHDTSSRFASVSSASSAQRAYRLQIISPPTSRFTCHMALMGMLPNFRWDLVLGVTDPGTGSAADNVTDAVNSSLLQNVVRKTIAALLSRLTWLYSLGVFALVLALWVRVIVFDGFVHAPVENIGYGTFYLLPIVILIRGWYCYGYRKDHERYVWDLLDQEEAELRAMDRADQIDQGVLFPAGTTDQNGPDVARATDPAAPTLPDPQHGASQADLDRHGSEPTQGLPATSVTRLSSAQRLMARVQADVAATRSGEVFPPLAGENGSAAGPDNVSSSADDRIFRPATGSMMRAVTIREEKPGLHHSRRRFLSVAWKTVDLQWGFFSIAGVLLVWVALNLHFFKPLFTGVAPSEIDWLLQVPPDHTDRKLLDVSVSGYCFALMFGSFLQVGLIVTSQNAHCFIGSLLMLRAERLRRRVKQLSSVSSGAADIWKQYLKRWHAKIQRGVSVSVYDPIATRWLGLQFSGALVFTAVFGGLLLYNGGASPRIPIFVITCMQFGWFSMYITVNDKRRALQHMTAEDLGLEQNTTAGVVPAGHGIAVSAGMTSSGLLMSGASKPMVSLPRQATNPLLTDTLASIPASSSSSPDSGVVAAAENASSAGGSFIGVTAHRYSTEVETDTSTAMHKFNVHHPIAMMRRLVPPLILQAFLISLVWIGWLYIRAWLNYLECSKSVENGGFLGFSYERCTTNEFTQISIESALTSYVRPCFRIPGVATHTLFPVDLSSRDLFLFADVRRTVSPVGSMDAARIRAIATIATCVCPATSRKCGFLPSPASVDVFRRSKRADGYTVSRSCFLCAANVYHCRVHLLPGQGFAVCGGLHPTGSSGSGGPLAALLLHF